MHLLETYALTTGSKIDKCYIHEEEIALPDNEYITLNTYSNRGNSRQYDYWDQIINRLINNPKFKYTIVQTGNADDPKHPNVDTSYLGRTNYHSLAYLMKNSKLHLGIDSFPVHIASHYDIKIVAIYFYYSSTCGPYFSTPSKTRILQPDFSKIKPVFAYNDPYRLINTIDPTLVYQSTIELLEL
jgi:ADP-heptose:LPS heptosyltransferase